MAMDPQSLRHLHALRDFIRELVVQTERSAGCECHRPPSLLLVGPPGAGKTYLVKQMSTVCDMPLFGVHTHQLTGPNSLRNLFVQARDRDYPSLFFLDDIDCIFSDHNLDPGHGTLAEALRRELYKQLGPRKLKIFDPNASRNPVKDSLPNTPTSSPQTPTLNNGVHDETPDNNGIILVAATSSPWLLYKDHELLSRFRGVYLVGLPDRETRFHLLKFLLQKIQHNLTEKDLWLVADKTEGYTPSDLMVITKSLNYEQLSFLFSMAGLQGYDGESSDEESISSSELTETDIDSNYDQVDEPTEQPKAVPPGLEQKLELKDSSSGSSSSRNVSVSSDEVKSADNKKEDTTLTALEKDWSCDSETQAEEEESPAEAKEDRKSSEIKEESCEDKPVSEGATNNSASTEQKDETNEVAETTKDGLEGSVSSSCDNSSNVKNGDVILKGSHSSSPENVCPVSDTVCQSDSSNKEASEPKNESDSDNETKEFELRVYHPPDPFPNDNQAVESGSGSESDNEISGDFALKRTRRVNFCNVASLNPLSIDVDHSDDMGANNNNLDYGASVSISPAGLEGSLLSKDSFCGPSANNILKRLLSSSPTLHDHSDDDNLNNIRSKNRPVSPIDKEDDYRRDDYMNVSHYSPSDLATNSLRGDATDSCRTRKENKAQDVLPVMFSRSPSGRRNSSTVDRRSTHGVSPTQLTGVSPRLTRISNQLTGVSPRLTSVSPQSTGVSPQLTPTGSDTSSHLATDNSSESGSGRRIRMITPPKDRKANKAREDSDSSLYGKSETPTIPSSDISTATCNVSGETLECHSDSDERLRNLEDDLKARRQRISASEDDDDTDEASGEENDTDTLRTILNLNNFSLNNLGEVSIKTLTINDILNAVNRTPRTVSAEEVKRYEDFMVWFSSVAKSACPHNSKDSMSDAASSADVSVASSLWGSQSPSTKKRKGPLRKLGRFLLKALMFILD